MLNLNLNVGTVYRYRKGDDFYTAFNNEYFDEDEVFSSNAVLFDYYFKEFNSAPDFYDSLRDIYIGKEYIRFKDCSKYEDSKDLPYSGEIDLSLSSKLIVAYLSYITRKGEEILETIVNIGSNSPSKEVIKYAIKDITLDIDYYNNGYYYEKFINDLISDSLDIDYYDFEFTHGQISLAYSTEYKDLNNPRISHLLDTYRKRFEVVKQCKDMELTPINIIEVTSRDIMNKTYLNTIYNNIVNIVKTYIDSSDMATLISYMLNERYIPAWLLVRIGVTENNYNKLEEYIRSIKFKK